MPETIPEEKNENTNENISISTSARLFRKNFQAEVGLLT